MGSGAPNHNGFSQLDMAEMTYFNKEIERMKVKKYLSFSMVMRKMDLKIRLSKLIMLLIKLLIS